MLARLPDVSAPRSTPSTAAPEPAPVDVEYVDYRFDAPAGREDQTSPIRRMTRPHAFDNPISEHRMRTTRRSPTIQPDSDPFSIPTTSLYDRLAPVAQFLMLFALFTAAGTAFLMKGGFAQQSHKTSHTQTPPATPATATVRQILEPATEDVDRTTTSPSASGPLGSKAASNAEDVFAGIEGRPAADKDKSSTTSTMAKVAGEPLPRVQTTEPQAAAIAVNSAGTDDPAPPPAIARLPGIILEVSPRQAQHDEQQPGLH